MAITIRCKVRNKSLYELLDTMFEQDCEMQKLKEGTYRGEGSLVLSNTFFAIKELQENKDFINSVELFIRDVDGEVEDILEFYGKNKFNIYVDLNMIFNYGEEFYKQVILLSRKTFPYETNEELYERFLYDSTGTYWFTDILDEVLKNNLNYEPLYQLWKSVPEYYFDSLENQLSTQIANYFREAYLQVDKI